MQRNIAFFGIGLMGSPLATRLLEEGHNVHVFNRDMEKALPLADRGARVTETAASALAEAELGIAMLTDDQAFRQVLLNPHVRTNLAGKTIVNMATIAPEQSRALQQDIAKESGYYFECPVLGSIPEAKTGKLILMVGGTEAQLEQWRDVLTCFGPNPTLIGAVGQAMTLKLAFNQLIASLTAAFSLSLGLVEREGVPLERFLELLRDSALYAPTFDKKLPRMLKHQYDNPNFPLQHLRKDVLLTQKAAENAQLDPAILDGVLRIIENGMERGYGNGDYSALHEAVLKTQ